MKSDAEHQYRYWITVRGCGIKRAARGKPVTRRVSSKRQAIPVRRARAKLFKWALGWVNPPIRNKLGLP